MGTDWLPSPPPVLENQWPPLEDCIQYQCDIIRPYLQKFDWEDVDDTTELEYLEYFSDEEEEGGYNRKITCSTLKKFVHEVRTTRGYGVDVKDPLPSYMHCPFLPYSEYGLHISEKWVNLALHHAIKYINNSNEDGKVYQHVNTLKVVDTPHGVLLLTFTATAKQIPEVSAQTATEVSAQKKRKMEVTAADEAELTFLAAVYAPGPDPGAFKLLECFLKPKGDAPWEYQEWT